MSKTLIPLILPQVVEERRKRESMRSSMLESPVDFDLTSPYDTQNSSASDIASPVTPTFSVRHKLRHSSSQSSMDVTPSTPVMDAPSSPSFGSLKPSKRSLPDVQEEPQEREEREEGEEGKDTEDDFDAVEPFDDDFYAGFCDDRQYAHWDPSMTVSSVQLSSEPAFDYNDGFFSDGEVNVSQRFKKRRDGESPFSAMATRLGTRLPSFSRKWRLRRTSNAMHFAAEAQRNVAGSRTASSRSSSLSDSFHHSMDKSRDPQLPPTPVKSVFEEAVGSTSIDIDKANRHSSEQEELLATTPLLPPVMVDTIATKSAPVQSPLQSPSVADACDPFALSLPALDAVATPQLPGMPSPPLSSKPSISSFRHVSLTRPGHLVPSADIPPIVIAADDDKWAISLGHANYNIYPEPYVPTVCDVEACRQLRANWDAARANYMRHLVRTGEHYGVTSKMYKLTEEKWAEIDAEWKKNNDLVIESTVARDGDAFSSLRHTTLGEDAGIVTTKIPSLNDPQGQGKFPQLGDEDIVGPMVVLQTATGLNRSLSKKAKILRFFAERFPISLGRSST